MPFVEAAVLLAGAHHVVRVLYPPHFGEVTFAAGASTACCAGLTLETLGCGCWSWFGKKRKKAEDPDVAAGRRLGVGTITVIPQFVPWKGHFVRKVGPEVYEWCDTTTNNHKGDCQMYIRVAYVHPSEAKPAAPTTGTVVTKTVASGAKAVAAGLTGALRKVVAKVTRTGEGCFPETNSDSQEPIPRGVGVLWRSDSQGVFHRVGLFCRVGNHHILTTAHGVYREKHDDSLVGQILDDGVWAVCSPQQDNEALDRGLPRPRLYDLQFLEVAEFGRGKCLTNRDFVLLRVSWGDKRDQEGSCVGDCNNRSLSRAEIRALKAGNFSRATFGTHYCVTRNPDLNRWVTREGQIMPHEDPFRAWGYVQHDISTHPGASGSIIWGYQDCQLKVRALHLGHLTEKDSNKPVGYNLGIGAAILRRACGEVKLIDFGGFGRLGAVAETMSRYAPRTIGFLGEAANKASGEDDYEHEWYGAENSPEELGLLYEDSRDRERSRRERDEGFTDSEEEEERDWHAEDESRRDELMWGGGAPPTWDRQDYARWERERKRSLKRLNRKVEALTRRSEALEATNVALATALARVTGADVVLPDSIKIGTRGDPHADPLSAPSSEQYKPSATTDLCAEKLARSARRAKAVRLDPDGQGLVPTGQTLVLPMAEDGLIPDSVVNAVDSINRGGNNGFRPGLSILHATSTQLGQIDVDKYWSEFTSEFRTGPLQFFEGSDVRLDYQYSDSIKPDAHNDHFEICLRHREKRFVQQRRGGGDTELSDVDITTQFFKFCEGETAALEGLLGVEPHRFYRLCCSELREYTASLLRRVRHSHSVEGRGWAHIGTFERSDPKAKAPREIPEDELEHVRFAYGVDVRKELEGYHIPSGTEAEMIASLANDAERRSAREHDHKYDMLYIQESFPAAFADLQSRVGVADHSRFENWCDLYVKALAELDLTKSAGASGFPLRGSTVDKGSALSARPGLVHALVAQRLALRYLCEYRRTEQDWHGYAAQHGGGLVENGRDYNNPADLPKDNELDGLCFALRDPELLFVKPEPHSQKKVREGRFRCIYVGSLVDVLVQSVLHKVLNNFIVQSYQRSEVGTSYALGLGHHMLGLMKLRRTVSHLASFTAEGASKVTAWEQWGDESFYGEPGLSEADATGWDNCVLGYMQAFAAELRCRAIDASASVFGASPELEAAYRVAKYLIRATALLDGCHVAIAGTALYVNSLVGVMASGHISTSVDNTSMRLFTTLAAYYLVQGWVPGDLIATGDDLLVGDGDAGRFLAVSRELERFGVQTKEGSASTSRTSVEYTSHRFDADPANPRGLCTTSHRALYGGTVQDIRVTYLNTSKTLCRFLSKIVIDPSGIRTVARDVLSGTTTAMRNADPQAFECLLRRLQLHPV